MATTNAGAIGVTVEANNVQFDSSMDKSAAIAERSMARVTRAQQSAAKDADRFVSSIQRQVDSFGLSGTALLRYEAQLKGVSAQAEPLIARLERMKDAQAAFAAEASKTTGAASLAKGFGDAEAAAGRASHGTAGVTRELLVLGHEASQGNWKRFGGSLLVLGELLTGTIASIGAVLVPIAAVAAAIGGFGIAAAVGASESKKLRDAIQLTGNFAGVTAGQVDAMSRSLAASSGAGIGKVRTALEELVKTGEVGPRSLAPMTTAVVNLERLTGESAENIVKDFARMGEGVAKWAAEHNKQFNFISGDQYAYIKRLEEQGLKEQAEAETLRLLNEHLKNLAPNLGLLERAWKSLGEAASSAWDRMKGVGRSETVEDRIAQTQAQIADMDAKQRQRRGLAAFSSAPEGQGNDTRAGLVQQQELNFRDQLRQSEMALGQAEADRAHKSQIAAIDARDHWREETKGVSLVNKELEKYRTLTVAPLKGTANEIGADEQSKTEAAIRKRFDPAGFKSGQQLDTRFKDRLEALTAEGIKLDHSIASYNLYGKAVDRAHEALLNLEIAQGKLKGLDPARIAQLRAVAQADDQKDKILAETEARVRATAAADKFVAKLVEEASAHAMNAREQDLANRIAELDRIGVQKNTAAYAVYVDAIERAVQAKHDQLLVNQLAAQQLTVSDEVHKLDEEVRLLSASALARQIATAQVRLYNQAQKDIAANPGKEADILEALAKKNDELAAAITRRYQAERTAQAGIDRFLTKYQEEASDAAKTTETLAQQATQTLEDSLTSLLSGQKVNFHSMVDALIQEIIRLSIIKPLLADIFGGITGGQGGGQFGLSGSSGLLGVLGKMIGGSGNVQGIGDKYNSSGAGGLLGTLAGLFSSGSGAAAGKSSADVAGIFGVYKQGTNYVPDNQLAFLHKGEAVIPASVNAAAGGSGRSSQTVHIHVSPPQGMDRGTAQQHGRDIGIGIRQSLARND